MDAQARFLAPYWLQPPEYHPFEYLRLSKYFLPLPVSPRTLGSYSLLIFLNSTTHLPSGISTYALALPYISSLRCARAGARNSGII